MHIYSLRCFTNSRSLRCPSVPRKSGKAKAKTCPKESSSPSLSFFLSCFCTHSLTLLLSPNLGRLTWGSERVSFPKSDCTFGEDGTNERTNGWHVVPLSLGTTRRPTTGEKEVKTGGEGDADESTKIYRFWQHCLPSASFSSWVILEGGHVRKRDGMIEGIPLWIRGFLMQCKRLGMFERAQGRHGLYLGAKGALLGECDSMFQS